MTTAADETRPDWREAWRVACTRCALSTDALLALAAACAADGERVALTLYSPVFPGGGSVELDKGDSHLPRGQWNPERPVALATGEAETGEAAAVRWTNANLAAEAMDALTFAAAWGRGALVFPGRPAGWPSVGEALAAYHAAYAKFPEPHRRAWFDWYERTPRAVVLAELAAECRTVVAMRAALGAA